MPPLFLCMLECDRFPIGCRALLLLLPVQAPADAIVEDVRLPFLVGRVLDEQPHRNDNILVEWFVPGSSRRSGRARARPDIFAGWGPLSAREVAPGDLSLPPVITPASSVLAGNVELDEEGCIPFENLDRLQTEHGIDVSGLSVSRTSRGNQYRAHLLMQGH